MLERCMMNPYSVRFTTLTLIASSGLVMSGCATATSSVRTVEAQPVPAERILSTEHSINRPDCGLIIVKRDTGSSGAKCTSRLIVDGKPIADLATGEKITLYLPFGEHIIGAEPNGECHGGFSTTSMTVQRGQPMTLRIRYGANGEFMIRREAM
jgi:hypothetical protein